jgi:hypothetical protein
MSASCRLGLVLPLIRERSRIHAKEPGRFHAALCDRMCGIEYSVLPEVDERLAVDAGSRVIGRSQVGFATRARRQLLVERSPAARRVMAALLVLTEPLQLLLDVRPVDRWDERVAGKAGDRRRLFLPVGDDYSCRSPSPS